MTNRTQAYKIIKNIRFVLEFKIATAFDVMNVKVSSVGAALCSTVETGFIALDYLPPDTRPIAPHVQLPSAAPMAAILANHKIAGAFLGAKLTPFFDSRREGRKSFPAILAGQNRSFFGGFVGALSTAILAIPFVAELYAATLANFNFSILFSVFGLASLRAKFVLDLPGFNPIQWPFEFLPAIIAGDGYIVATVRAALRTMIDVPLICFELFFAMETDLDHR